MTKATAKKKLVATQKKLDDAYARLGRTCMTGSILDLAMSLDASGPFSEALDAAMHLESNCAELGDIASGR